MSVLCSLSAPPAIIIPSDLTEDMWDVSGASKLPGDVSTILPVAYNSLEPLPEIRQAWMVHDSCPAIPCSTRVYVRRFDEGTDTWDEWALGVVVDALTTYRPLGPQRACLVEFDKEGERRREEFMPYLGEVWDPAQTSQPSAMPEHYYQSRRNLNLVYIPIMTSVKEGDVRKAAMVLYLSQALNATPRCTEWQVCVLHGPYMGVVMRSKRAYFADNELAILALPEYRDLAWECCESMSLIVEHEDSTVLPPGKMISS